MSFLGIGGRDRKNNVAKELNVSEKGDLINPNTLIVESETSNRYTTPILFGRGYLGQFSSNTKPLDLTAGDKWYLIIKNDTNATIRFDRIEYVFNESDWSNEDRQSVTNRVNVAPGTYKIVKSEDLDYDQQPYGMVILSTSGASSGKYSAKLISYTEQFNPDGYNKINRIEKNTSKIASVSNHKYFKLSSPFHDDGYDRLLEEARPCTIQSLTIMGKGNRWRNIDFILNSLNMDETDYFVGLSNNVGTSVDERLRFGRLLNMGGENSIFKLSKADEENDEYALFLKRPIHAPLGFRLRLPDHGESYVAELSVLYYEGV